MNQQPPVPNSSPPSDTSAAPAFEISIVVPAFNEERRLPPMLVDCLYYLETHFDSYEVIVVDDGSTDATVEVVNKFSRLHPSVRVHALGTNRGKGFAVKAGMLETRGALCLFADADGATPFAELERLLIPIRAGADIAIGSRALASRDTAIKTRWYRKYLGRTFNACVNALILPGVADTQCGFKLFTARAARAVFPRQSSARFSFDVEILFIARQLGFKIVEVAINWVNIPGSKVHLIIDSMDMLRDVIRFRWKHRGLRPDPSTRTP